MRGNQYQDPTKGIESTPSKFQMEPKDWCPPRRKFPCPMYLVKFEYFTCLAEIRPVTIVMKFAEIVSLLGSILLMVQKSCHQLIWKNINIISISPCFQKGLSISTASPRFRKTMTPQLVTDLQLPNVQFGPAVFFFARGFQRPQTPDPHRGQGSRHKLGGGFAKIKPRCRWPWNLWNCVISAFLRCFCGAQQLWHIKMYAYNYNIIWFNYFFRCVLIHIYIVYIVHTRSAGKFLKCTFEEYQKNIKTPPKITHG